MDKRRRRLTTLIILGLLLIVPLITALGYSLWIVPEFVEVKPELGIDKIMINYYNGSSAPYDGNISLPASGAFGENANIIYYYKPAGGATYYPVDVDIEQGPIDAGQYEIKIEYQVNGEVVKVYEGLPFKIEKKTIDMSNLLFEDKTTIYNRDVQTIDYSGVPSEIKEVTYSYIGNLTDVGEYDITLSFELKDPNNYAQPEPITKKLTITEKSITLASLSFEGNTEKTFIYTSNAISEIHDTFKVVDNDGTILKEGTDYEVVFSELTQLGTNHTATITGIKNYKESNSINYTIKEKSYVLLVTPVYSSGQNYQEFTYNGEIQRPLVNVTDDEGNEVSGVTLTYSIETKNQGNYIGNNAVTVTASKDGYVDGVSEPINVTISAIPLQVNWSNTSTTYNKQSFAPTAEVVGLLGNDGVTYEVSGAQTNVGTYTATLSLVGNEDGNYTLANNYKTCAFVISAKSISLDKTLYTLDYSSTVRKWADISAAVKGLLSFKSGDVITGDTVAITINGMHNGIYSYGTVSGTGYDTSMTNVVGSTYQVTVSIDNTNYKLSKNTFVLKYRTVKANSVFCTIEDAFLSTGTITLLGDASSDSTYVVTSFTKLTTAQGNPYKTFEFNLSSRTLDVPYDNGGTGIKYTYNNGLGNVYSALNIPEGVTINMSGTATISVGGILDQGGIVERRGVVMNNGTINVASGCNYNSYGFTKGNGTINLASGASAYDVFYIQDWPGADEAIDLKNAKAFPVQKWSVHNISCPVKIYKNAVYNSTSYIIVVSGAGKLEIKDIYIVGSEGTGKCLFKPGAGSTDSDYILKSATIPNDSFVKSNQDVTQQDTVIINGTYEDSQVEVVAKYLIFNYTFATSTEIAIPIDYFNITVASGSYLKLYMTSYIFRSTNAKLVVEQDAVLEVSNGYLALINGSTLHLNGELSGDGAFGGNIITTKDETTILISTLAVDTIIQKTSSTTHATTSQKSYATVKNANDEIVENTELSTGISYVSESTDETDTTPKVYYFVGNENVYKYVIEFDTMGGETIPNSVNNSFDMSHTITHNDLPEPTRMHYDFAYWYYLDSNSNEIRLTSIDLTTTNEVKTATLRIYAKWTLHKYNFGYNAGYGFDENGNINYLDSNSGIVFDNVNPEFTIESFVNNVLNITTTASYSADGVSKYFNGWFVGIDTSTGIPIKSITLDQLTAFVEMYGVENDIPLYCEFTDLRNCNVIITDPINNLITQSFIIREGMTISQSGFAIKSFDYITYDEDTSYKYYYNGFIDSNNNVYTLEELENLIITSDITLTINWVEKYSVTFNKYDYNKYNFSSVVEYYLPGETYEIPDYKSHAGYLFDGDVTQIDVPGITNPFSITIGTTTTYDDSNSITVNANVTISAYYLKIILISYVSIGNGLLGNVDSTSIKMNYEYDGSSNQVITGTTSISSEGASISTIQGATATITAKSKKGLFVSRTATVKGGYDTSCSSSIGSVSNGNSASWTVIITNDYYVKVE